MAKPKSPFTEFVDSTTITQYAAAADVASSESQLDFLTRPGEEKKLKAFVRAGHWSPSDPLRHCLWYKLCLRHRNTGTSVYRELEKEYCDGGRDISLPAFVDQSKLERYHVTEHGAHVVTRLLYVLGKSHPDVIYAPSLYSIACLLLHYMTDEKAYMCMEALLSAKGVGIPQTHISYEASGLVLRNLLKKHAKKTYDWLRQQAGGALEELLADWLMWIFNDLPFTHVVCVMDCYFNEGTKVLYRVASHCSRCSTNIKVPKRLSQSCLTSADISEFCRNDMAGIAIQIYLKTSFNIRGLAKKEIKKLVNKREMYIQSVHTTKALQSNLVSNESRDSNDGHLKVAVPRSFSLQDVKSNLLTVEQWDTIWSWIPDRVTLLVPTLLFSTSEHGTSLTTFYNHVQDRDGNPATLLVIKTTTGKLFGAYCSTDWDERLHQDKSLAYFGTGETFVFTLSPSVQKYQWVGIALQRDTPSSAHMFMAGDCRQIYVGGGGGVAIRLDENLCSGRSERCDTFNNPPLSEDTDFTVATLEVFGFVS